jgi:hypothetical protein
MSTTEVFGTGPATATSSKKQYRAKTIAKLAKSMNVSASGLCTALTVTVPQLPRNPDVLAFSEQNTPGIRVEV